MIQFILFGAQILSLSVFLSFFCLALDLDDPALSSREHCPKMSSPWML
jgi:hypothetical protein